MLVVLPCCLGDLMTREFSQTSQVPFFFFRLEGIMTAQHFLNPGTILLLKGHLLVPGESFYCHLGGGCYWHLSVMHWSLDIAVFIRESKETPSCGPLLDSHDHKQSLVFILWLVEASLQSLALNFHGLLSCISSPYYSYRNPPVTGLQTLPQCRMSSSQDPQCDYICKDKCYFPISSHSQVLGLGTWTNLLRAHSST